VKYYASIYPDGDRTKEEGDMERTRILLLSLDAGQLVQPLVCILEEVCQRVFEVRKEALHGDRFAEYGQKLSKAASRSLPNLVVLCLSPAGRKNAGAVFDLARKHLQGVPILIATESTDLEEWRDWLKLDPDDFLTPPFRPFEVLSRIGRLGVRIVEDDAVVLQLKEKLGLKQLVGESPALVAEIRKIPLVARCDACVLVTGETGTGKEMFARAIHHLGSRSAKPFSPVNCGAIPVDLLENELFGHEPGAYTSASSFSAGLIRETDGGTLFLDEVDCLPLMAQVKLLRFLQDREFRPLGARKPCRADVRVIAASNANLDEAVAKGRFRQDLFFRVNVVSLALPPLRERKEDVPILARHFLEKHASASGEPARGLNAAAIQKLMLHDWPGNVRELENVLERSLILSTRTMLHPEDIQLPEAVSLKERESFRSMKAKTIEQFERSYIQGLLRAHDGNISKAACAAGKHRRAFWEIMRKHQITVTPPDSIPAPPDRRRLR
jgi:two-component system response regulator GlrR